MGYSLRSNGWGLFADMGTRKTAEKTAFWEFEFAEIKSPKQVKQSVDVNFTPSNFDNPKPYVFAKQNNFYQLNASVGRAVLLTDKPNVSGGIEVRLKYMAGVSLGLLKPYYLVLISKPDNTGFPHAEDVKYQQDTSRFLDWNSIWGASRWALGVDEIKFVPGAHFKAGLSFDWAIFPEYVKSIDIGASLDAYYKRVPIMVTEKNPMFFPSIFLSLQFGKKY